MKLENSIGNCTNEGFIEELFGSVSEFARLVEENGDNFIHGNIKVVYDDVADIHWFVWII